MDKSYEAFHKFHQHLDNCSICYNNVFNLCDIGSALLAGVAKTMADDVDDITIKRMGNMIDDDIQTIL